MSNVPPTAAPATPPQPTSQLANPQQNENAPLLSTTNAAPAGALTPPSTPQPSQRPNLSQTNEASALLGELANAAASAANAPPTDGKQKSDTAAHLGDLATAAASVLNGQPAPQVGAAAQHADDIEMGGKKAKVTQVLEDLSQFIPANEANAYSSIKSATNGVISTSNLSLYIGILIAAFSPGGTKDPFIITISILAFLASALAIVLSCYLFAMTPKQGDRNTNSPASFSVKAQRINNVIAILSPISLVLNMVISSWVGKGGKIA
ncbi:hypothetical protein HDV00_008944 [Rhizophlyctis rosea]|nr:hypothetical protein HDV00_008944 [Rhizophlyctis rosea]